MTAKQRAEKEAEEEAKRKKEEEVSLPTHRYWLLSNLLCNRLHGLKPKKQKLQQRMRQRRLVVRHEPTKPARTRRRVALSETLRMSPLFNPSTP